VGFLDLDAQLKRLEAAAEFCNEIAKTASRSREDLKNNQLKLKYAKQQLMLISVEIERMLK
jgi:hypothetical protein